MSEHTPTPWDFEGGEDCCRIVSYIDPKREQIAVRLNEADAELIVRAVNSHGALLEAVKQAADYINNISNIDPDDEDEEIKAVLNKAIAHAEGRGNG